MRISSTMMVNGYLKQLNTSYENQTKLMEQSDGSKLHRPSDNAVDYSKFLRYQNSKTENIQYQTNVSNAISWMKNSDASLVDICNCLSTVVEKTNAAANGTNTESDMAAIAKEMMAMVQQSVSDANVQVDGRYLLSGQRDLIQPFNMSNEKKSCGVVKTMDDNQKMFFNSSAADDQKCDSVNELSQMLILKGTSDGGKTYQTYYLNTLNGNIYTEDFIVQGYKDAMAGGRDHVEDADKFGDKIAVYTTNISGVPGEATAEGVITLTDQDDIDYFKTTKLRCINDGTDYYYLNAETGVVYDKTLDRTKDPVGTAKNIIGKYFENTGIIKPDGKTWVNTQYVGGKTVKLTFDTVDQYVVTYNGDDKYISMVKQNGEIQPASDTVNVTGHDVFGSNIFDDAASGNERSATSALNDILAIVAKTEACDHHWLGQTGLTLANNSYNTVLGSESRLASRQQVYTAMQQMLTTQNATITGDISRVSDTDVAQLAVNLMSAQLIYNMALSVGGKILPGSLADYL